MAFATNRTVYAAATSRSSYRSAGMGLSRRWKLHLTPVPLVVARDTRSDLTNGVVPPPVSTAAGLCRWDDAKPRGTLDADIPADLVAP